MKTSHLGAGILLAAGAAWLGAGVASAQETERETEKERHEAVTLLPSPGMLAFSGSGAFLGVQIRDVDASLADEAGLEREYGAYVEEVSEDGPAAQAGIEDGDVIVSWNGERLESVAQLRRLISETPPGRTVDLGLVRDGTRRDVSVTLGNRSVRDDLEVFTVPRGRARLWRGDGPALRERIREALPGRFRVEVLRAGRPRLGVGIQSLGEQLADYFGVEQGVLVTSVEEDSPAASAGLKAGDVIVAVEDEDVEDPEDLFEALSEREAGPVELRIVRDRAERTVTVELEERGSDAGLE